MQETLLVYNIDLPERRHGGEHTISRARHFFQQILSALCYSVNLTLTYNIQSYRGHSPRDSLRDESLGETSYTILLGTPGPWENVKLILLGILLGTGP